MPIVDGRYESKISTVYATVDGAKDEVKKSIKKARRIRINTVPMTLLEELKPLLRDKDLKIILPLNQKPTEELKKLGEAATTKSRIYVDYKGREANSGSIAFSDKIFNITWINEEILEVSSMEYGKCVKCLADTFEMAWRYSQKW